MVERGEIMGFIGTLKKTLKAAISPWIKKVEATVSPRIEKVKSMRFFERDEDSIETSRLRLELREATLKSVVYIPTYFFIAWVVLPRVPVPDNFREDTSVFIGIIGFTILTITIGLSGFVELMKARWLFRVLGKKNPP